MSDINLPFEPIPDGPQAFDVAGHVAGGIIVRSAVVPAGGPDIKPCLIFDFVLATGRRLTPVVLVLSDEQMADLVPLVTNAVDLSIATAERVRTAGAGA